jgi:hypothetical protein
MAREIDFSSYECDCGHQLHFFENTIREMKQTSHRKRVGLSEGTDEHVVFFYKGQRVEITCPRDRKRPRPSSQSGETPPSGKPPFTPRQGQVLSFIHLYTRLHGRSPAEADIAQRFGIMPPSAHQMVVVLERKGLIARQAGTARSIILRIDPAQLPELE